MVRLRLPLANQNCNIRNVTLSQETTLMALTTLISHSYRPRRNSNSNRRNNNLILS